MDEKKYQIKGSIWFTPQIPPAMIVGAVAIARDHDADEWKAYIGLAGGKDEAMDEQFVAGFGAKITDKTIAEAFFPQLDIERFVA